MSLHYWIPISKVNFIKHIPPSDDPLPIVVDGGRIGDVYISMRWDGVGPTEYALKWVVLQKGLEVHRYTFKVELDTKRVPNFIKRFYGNLSIMLYLTQYDVRRSIVKKVVEEVLNESGIVCR
jgi:hypothetical protein